jgi:tetratricopeptide (TPR) repeat protein
MPERPAPVESPGKGDASAIRWYAVRRLERWLPVAIVAAGVLAYANSFPGPFIFDDASSITANPGIYHFWRPWKARLHPTRWVADVSFAVNYAATGFTPADFRFTNLLIHLGTGLLLYGIVRRTLRLPRLSPRYGDAASWLAGAVSLVWTVHPLQTESVTYIAQRIEALMGLFYCLVVYCFVRGCTAPRPRHWFDAAIAAAMVGAGTKEVIVTAPVFLLLYDGLCVASSWGEALRARWRVHLALFATIGVFVMLFLMAIAGAAATGGLLFSAVSPWRYALTQPGVVAHYLRLAVVPHPLCLDYRWPLAESIGPVLVPGVLVGCLLAATLWGLWRRQPLAVLGAAFFLPLAPTSSILPLPDAAFEHRMYLSLAAVVAAAVLAACAFSRIVAERAPGWRAVAPWAGALVVAGVAVVLTVMTRARNLDYRSDDIMWDDVIRKRPDNYRAYIGLSFALIGQDRYGEAMGVCSNLLRRLRDYASVPAEQLEKPIPYDAGMYAQAHNNLAVALLNLERADEAIVHCREALRVAPENRWAHNNLAYALFTQRRYEEAIAHWYEALRLQPENAKAHCFLGLALGERGRHAVAARHFRRALEIQPDLLFARAQLAWLLATCPDPAVRNGLEALRTAEPLPAASEGRSPRAWDILAAACAEAGDFTRAVSLAERALDLARQPPSLRWEPLPTKTSGTDTQVGADAAPALEQRAYTVEALEQRLQEYRRGCPHREGGKGSSAAP